MPNKKQNKNKTSTAVKRLNRSNPSSGSSLLPGDGKVYSNLSVQPRQIDTSSKVFNCILTTEDFTFLSTSTTLVSTASKQFQLSDCTGYADLISVFDQYRIVSIECYLTPTGSTASTNDGKLTSVIDFDDASALTGLTAYAYSNAVTSSGVSCHYRHFIPHAANALYGSGVFTSFGNVASPWIDAGSVSVPHYGLKAISTVTTAVRAYDLTSRLHLQFRNCR
jgi:hypothetical protein